MSASNSSTQHEAKDVERYRAAFKMFDKGGRGRISASDLGMIMKQLGKNPTPEELQGLRCDCISDI